MLEDLFRGLPNGSSPASLEVSMSNTHTPVKEIADTIRGMIKNEDELTSERLTWLGQFEAILFAAYGLLIEKLQNGQAMTWVILALGLAIALSVWVGTHMAYRATGRLVKQWDEYKKEHKGEPWVPDVQGIRGEGLVNFLMPGYLVPKLFFLAWLAIAIGRVVRH
jgi:hypothetical protein